MQLALPDDFLVTEPANPSDPLHPAATVGGGLKKVLYTLSLAKDMGFRPTTKALTANNTCKACGLGMGGQKGGMTNERGEFPAVCNKSVQAQSSDLAPPIPQAIFDHTLDELAELTELEMNKLGRLDTPLYKAPDSQRYTPIPWAEALSRAASWLLETEPQRAFFYSSGRASNEAGFILQLFARLYGTNNVNNCSYYCHQATSVALASTIGTGTATIELDDLQGCDFILLAGANPASNHPRFMYELQNCRARGGDVVVVNPAKENGLVRFAAPKNVGSLIAGGTEVASVYLQPHIGSDISVYQGIAKALIELDAVDPVFIQQHTTGYEAYRARIEATTWSTLCEATGLSQVQFVDTAKRYAAAHNAVFAWGMGLTHHLHGVQNIEELTHLALLRGMVGKRHAGLLPLRGHSNVQGIGTIGVKPVLPEEVFKALENHLDITLSRDKGLDTMAAMQAAADGQIDVGVFLGGNLFAANPDSRWAAGALSAIRHKIFATTTLNRGHVCGAENSAALIFPVCARDEEPQATTQESMFNYVRLSDGGISRMANARSESSLLVDLASAVIPSEIFDFTKFATHSSVRKAIAATVPGMENLASIDVAKREFHVANRVLHNRTFNTADGRVHFVADHQPQKQERTRSAEWPFSLATVRSEGQFNSIVYEEHDTYRNVPHRWSVLMGATDLRALNIKPGDKVTLRSPWGEMKAVSVYSCDLPTGNLLAYYPEANCLTGTSVDSRSKTPAFKNTPIQVLVD